MADALDSGLAAAAGLPRLVVLLDSPRGATGCPGSPGSGLRLLPDRHGDRPSTSGGSGDGNSESLRTDEDQVLTFPHQQCGLLGLQHLYAPVEVASI